MPLNLVVPEGGQRMQDAVEQLARMVEVRAGHAPCRRARRACVAVASALPTAVVTTQETHSL